MKCIVKHKFCNNIVNVLFFADVVVTLTIFILDTSKLVPWQAVKTQMKYGINRSSNLPVVTFAIY